MTEPTAVNKNPAQPLTEFQLETLARLVSRMQALHVVASFKPPVSEGPIVSCFRFVPTGSTRVSDVENLAPDFAVTCGVENVLVKRLPGESSVGVYIPKPTRTPVRFTDAVTAVWKCQSPRDAIDKLIPSPLVRVPLAFGVDWLGNPFVEDLATLPHLLIAGSTGSGKSTLVSSILAALVYCVPSSEIKLILSDTKNVEFGHFVGAPHLLFEPATSVFRTMEQLDWVIEEMGNRLKKISAGGCRNVFEYKTKFPTSEIPYIVVVIDELADLLLDRTKEDKGPSIGKVCEGMLGRIVQKSRAAGVYVIAATQRPSVNVVAGSVKANFPARLSFRLPSGPDSRTVIGTEGAEHLLSQGDCLYQSPNRPGLVRLHSPYSTTDEISAAVEAAIQKEAQNG